MHSKTLTALIAALSACAGAVATLWLSNDPGQSPRAEAARSEEMAALRKRLAKLEEQLQQVIIASVDVDGSPPPAREQRQSETGEPKPEPATAEERGTSWQRSQQRREQREREQLLTAGWTEAEIDELRRLRGLAQLKSLEQQHLAAREIRARYPEAARLMLFRDPLRDELGDDKYGAYLEALGRPAAVRVSRLVPGSAGEIAGLREGDMIRSYAGKRVFNGNDLEQVSLSGEYGESVTLEVLRDGTTFYLTVPRGPVGLSMMMH